MNGATIGGRPVVDVGSARLGRDTARDEPSLSAIVAAFLSVGIALIVGGEQLLAHAGTRYLQLLYLAIAVWLTASSWAGTSRNRRALTVLAGVGWLATCVAVLTSNRDLPLRLLLGSSGRILLLASVLLCIAFQDRNDSATVVRRFPRWPLTLAASTAVLGLLVAASTGYQPRSYSSTHLAVNYSTASGAERLPGFLASPNELGLVLAVCAVGLMFRWRRFGGRLDAALAAAASGAVFYSGTRTALVVLVFGLTCAFALPLSILVGSRRQGRRLRLGTALAITVVIAAIAVPAWGTYFSGRSLLPGSATDGSATYRQDSLQRLNEYVRLTHPLGGGFYSGNQLAPSPITAVVPNIDDNYYYLYLGVGLIGCVGIALLLLAWFGAHAKSAFSMSVAFVGMYLIASVTENLAASAPVTLAFFLAWSSHGGRWPEDSSLTSA